MFDFIIKYWVEWLCGIIATGVVFFARYYVKLQKKDFENRWKKRKNEVKTEILQHLEGELQQEVTRSTATDTKIETEIEVLNNQIENVNTGVLSIQGKQFRDMCLMLLEPDHVITVQEYEQFEEDYAAYKALGGNHRGDALYAAVVEKFKHQIHTL